MIFCPKRVLEKFAPGGPPAQTTKFCYMGLSLPCNSSPWCESCLFISEPAQPQAQWSKDKDKCQATCVHHCCTASSSWLWRTPKQGVSAESWKEAGVGAGLRAPPSLRSSVSLARLGASFVYPIRLGNPLAAGAVSPPTGQSFSEHRDFFYSQPLV